MPRQTARKPKRRVYRNLRAFLDDLERQGHTQGDFAEAIGISEGHLSDLKNGRERPSLELAAKLADVANIPIESFLNTVVDNVGKSE